MPDAGLVRGISLKLFNLKLKVPAVFTADRYVIAQVTLYLLSVGMTFTALIQIQAAFGGSNEFDAALVDRMGSYVHPAVFNLFIGAGLFYLSNQLQRDPTGAIWTLSVGALSMQLLLSLIELLWNFDVMPVVIISMQILGLGSLFVGRNH